jgi:hypothetical protein
MSQWAMGYEIQPPLDIAGAHFFLWLRHTFVWPSPSQQNINLAKTSILSETSLRDSHLGSLLVELS